MKSPTKRIIAYRITSIASEFLIVFTVTGGNFLIPSITTPICILVHTGLHYLIEKIWK